jgi:hypothetical protein
LDHADRNPMLHVLIVEPHAEVAAAFQRAIASARYVPVVRSHIESLADLGVTPALIVMRIGHADVSHLPPDRPPILAIASTDADLAEASRLRCEVVLRVPGEVRRLFDAVRSLAHA